MRINKTKITFGNSTPKSNQLSEKNEINNEINKQSNSSNINNIKQESPKDLDLSEPAPNLLNYKAASKKINKEKFYQMLEVEFDNENFRLFIYINDDDNLIIELVPINGNIPHSYKNTFNEEKFFKINKIFMELKTMEKIGQKIINLFKKEKVLLGKNKKEEIYYIILKITVIDEDMDIFIPLYKNEDIQLCTINYLLKETDKLKNQFNEYKEETEEIIKHQNEEINELKKINSLYLQIINKINDECKNKKIEGKNKEIVKNIIEEEIINNDNKIILNEEDNKQINVFNDIIIDDTEEIKIMEKKIQIFENKLKSMNDNYKCDINAKYKILNISINQAKPYIYIYFELLNTGLNPLTSELDDIFCNIEGISENSISFYNDQEKYIYLPEALLPNQKIIISKKIILNNPIINRKYDFYINIYSLNHGKISMEPIKFNICIRDKDYQKNFLSFLKNEKFDFNYKKIIENNKIILEYANIIDIKNENNFKPINKKDREENKYFKIRKFLYDEKSGMALEDKNKIPEIIDKKQNIILDNKFLEMNIVINKEDIGKIIKNLKNKYTHLKEFETDKLEEIICSCVGDFSTICTFIEKMV